MTTNQSLGAVPPLPEPAMLALIEEHLGLVSRRDGTVVNNATGRWTDAARYFDLIAAAIAADRASQATAELPNPTADKLKGLALALSNAAFTAGRADMDDDSTPVRVNALQATRQERMQALIDAIDLAGYEAGRASRAQTEWQPIDTAPEHKEVLLWRADAGAFTGIYTAAEEFLSDSDAAKLSVDDLESQDWFGGDYAGSWRLDGDEKPTHWQPLPLAPATPGETK